MVGRSLIPDVKIPGRQRSKSSSEYDVISKGQRRQSRANQLRSKAQYNDDPGVGTEDDERNPFLLHLPRHIEPGIVCSDSDLQSILSGRDIDLNRSGPRHSITMVRKGLLIKGFLSQELGQQMDRDRILMMAEERRRISTGSFELQSKSDKDQLGGTQSRKKTSVHGLSNLERERIVAWDQEQDFSVDPLVIGSVIESFLKKHDHVPASGGQSNFLSVPGARTERGSSLCEPKNPLSPTLAHKVNSRRAKSMDVTGQGQVIPAPPAQVATKSGERRYLTVDEVDTRPRRLSWKPVAPTERRNSTRLQTHAEIETSFKEMTLV